VTLSYNLDLNNYHMIKEDILDFFLNRNCFIFGGQIYKKELRGEYTEDIDIACDDIHNLKNEIIKDCAKDIKYNYRKYDNDYMCYMDVQCVTSDSEQIKIEILYKHEMLLRLSENPKPLKLIRTKDGFRYISKYGIIKNDTDKIDNVIDDIKNKKIRLSNNAKMHEKTDKHKKYFADWERYRIIKNDY
jgi:hypothetical protein